MSNTNEVASKYAKALYAQAKEDGVQEKVLEELRDIQIAFSGEAQLSAFLGLPSTTDKVVQSLITDIISKSQFSMQTQNLLKLVAHNSRLDCLSKVCDFYQQAIDNDMGVIRGTVKSASVLNPDERKQVEESIQKLTSKKPVLVFSEDKSLLGGLVADVGSYKIDGSVINQINLIRKTLTGGAH